MSLKAAVQYAHDNFNHYLEELKQLARIPSISFEGFPKEMVRKSAEAVETLLKKEGLENVQVLELPGVHPYVYGEWLHAPGKPTLLLYAHHDVQPVGQEGLWKSRPFEPETRDGRLFGRGTADDKAGILVHVAAIAAYLKTAGKLPLNVKILIEGEEEIGSEHLTDFLQAHRKLLQADVMVLTDTSNFDTGIPTITTALRGIVVLELELRAMSQSLHSGSFGGPVPDPVIALSKIIAELVDDEGKIQIPGIYDKVRPLSTAEEASVKTLNYTNDAFKHHAGFLPGVQIVGGPANPLVKTSRLPSISVNAIQASNRQSPANIINASAWCKISIRTVPDMKADETKAALINFIKARIPWGLELVTTSESAADWWLCEPKGTVFEKAKAAMTEAFGRECVFLGQGGSIPFVGPFSEILKAPALLIGVEDPYTNAHSENESLHLGDFQKSIEGAIRLYDSLAHD